MASEELRGRDPVHAVQLPLSPLILEKLVESSPSLSIWLLAVGLPHMVLGVVLAREEQVVLKLSRAVDLGCSLSREKGRISSRSRAS